MNKHPRLLRGFGKLSRNDEEIAKVYYNLKVLGEAPAQLDWDATIKCIEGSNWQAFVSLSGDNRPSILSLDDGRKLPVILGNEIESNPAHKKWKYRLLPQEVNIQEFLDEGK